MTQTQNSALQHLAIDQVDSLISAAGVDGARAILDAFQRSTLDLLLTLNNELNAGALTDVCKTAHAVKGSAANVGAQLLADAASSIEQACLEGDNHAAIEKLNLARTNFDAFCAHFDAHLAQL